MHNQNTEKSERLGLTKITLAAILFVICNIGLIKPILEWHKTIGTILLLFAFVHVLLVFVLLDHDFGKCKHSTHQQRHKKND